MYFFIYIKYNIIGGIYIKNKQTIIIENKFKTTNSEVLKQIINQKMSNIINKYLNTHE